MDGLFFLFFLPCPPPKLPLVYYLFSVVGVKMNDGISVNTAHHLYSFPPPIRKRERERAPRIECHSKRAIRNKKNMLATAQDSRRLSLHVPDFAGVIAANDNISGHQHRAVCRWFMSTEERAHDARGDVTFGIVDNNSGDDDNVACRPLPHNRRRWKCW